MARLRLVALALSVLTLAAVIAASSSRPALAVGSQIRTFVASTGSDANPCSRTAPCRTFAAALVQTTSGGEVIALDTGGYGTLTITQSVTITAAPGVQAFIAPSTGTAITVNAPNATVILRNLALNNVGDADLGVDYRAGSALHIENVSIHGFFGPIGGVGIGISKRLSDAHDLYVTDTSVRGSYWGMWVDSFPDVDEVVILRARAEQNVFGIEIDGGLRAVIKDSVVAANTIGVIVSSDYGPVDANLENSVVTGNGSALHTSGASDSVVLRVSNCTITGNGTGIWTIGGQILSRGNNTLEGNNTNGSFSGTYAAK